jgi:hypothetical protein
MSYKATAEFEHPRCVKRRTTFYLSVKNLARLREIADAEGVPQSGVIDVLIDRHYEANRASDRP